MKKKFLLLVLAAAITLAALPCFSVGAAEVVDSGTCGDNLVWTLDDEGTLTISGTGEMWNWKSASSTTFYSNRSSIKAVVIENGVTSIGDYAFGACERSLTSVTISDSVISIGYRAFAWCFSLSSISIPDSVTKIGEDAFYACTGLTSVIIPGSVTEIGDYAFYNCTGLTSVTIPDSVTYIGDTTFGSTGLTSVTIPDSVTSIGDGAFCCCTNLTSVTIPGSVTSIGDFAFKDTAYYNDESNWEGGVLYIGNYLIEVKEDISGEYTVKDGTVCIADSAFSSFEGCDSLTNVIIPESVITIGDWAFCSCDSLTRVTIPDSVTSIGSNVFQDCNNLTVYCCENSAAHEYAESNGVKYVLLDGGEGIYPPTTTAFSNVNDYFVFDVLSEINLDGKVLIIALYGKGGELLELVNVPQTRPLTSAYVVMRANPAAVKAKIFLWQSVETVSPEGLCEEIHL